MKKTDIRSDKQDRTDEIIEINGRRYRRQVKKSALPFWAAAAVWLVAMLCLPMYSLLHILLIGLVSAVVGFAAAKLIPKESELTELPFYEGNQDLNHVAGQISDAREALICARDKIAAEKPQIAATLTEIEGLCGKIQSAVLASPEDLPKIRRFLNYYLPITEKLANKYVLVVAQGGAGVNITETEGNIEAALSTVRGAFAKQLDALFSDDALDISTDITVMETLLARDDLR